MKKSTKIHFLIVSFINLFLATLLIWSVFNSGSCKSVLVIIIPFPILIALNGMIGFILFLIKKTDYKIYKINSLGLFILLLLGLHLAIQG
jgi:hypothetical protein